ncbi:hypothetical protein TrVE_jg14138 [Triparma verrucosa]|uniref:Uncharacterized protein n=1 Tax=Triparma verrucosa TaxID=1606542 RepID=A0A9W7C3U3_9STRA|nr:hypothetical protein TrVE_jg14138 [Triparma verrucosa]
MPSIIIDATPEMVFAYLSTGKIPPNVHHNVAALPDVLIRSSLSCDPSDDENNCADLDGAVPTSQSKLLSIAHKQNTFSLHLTTKTKGCFIAFDLRDTDEKQNASSKDFLRAGLTLVKIKGCKVIISPASYDRSSVEVIFRKKVYHQGHTKDDDDSEGSDSGASSGDSTREDSVGTDTSEANIKTVVSLVNVISSKLGIRTSFRSANVFGTKDDANRRKFSQVWLSLAKIFADPVRVDKAMMREFRSNLASPPPLTSMEKTILEDAQKSVAALESKWSYAPCATSDSLRTSFASDFKNSKWGRAEGLVHANIIDVLSFLGCFKLAERAKYDGAMDLPRDAIPKLNTRLQMTYECVRLPPPQRIRRLENWTTWDVDVNEKGAQTFLFVSTPTVSLPGYDTLENEETETLKRNTDLARFKGIFLLTAIGEKMTSLVTMQRLDLGLGFASLTKLPFQQRTMAEAYLKKFLDRARHVQTYFIKPWINADRLMTDVIAAKIQSRKGQPLDEDQVTLVKDCLILGKGQGGTLWTKVASKSASSPYIKTYIAKVDARTTGILNVGHVYKATIILDTDVVHAAAWFVNFCSLQRMRTSQKHDEIARVVIDHPSRENECTIAKILSMPQPLKNREFVAKQIWRHDDDGVVYVTWKDALEDIDYGEKHTTQRGKNCGYYMITPLENGKCSVETRQAFQFGGLLRNWSAMATKQLQLLQDAKDFFDRSEELDEIMNRAFVEVANKPISYSVEEENIIQRGLDFYSAISARKRNPVVFDDPEVDISWVESEKGSLAGIGSAIVDASIFSCLADEWLSAQGNIATKNYYKKGGLKKIRWPFNDHHELMLNQTTFSSFLDPREFRIRRIWKMLDDGRIIMYTEDTDEIEQERQPGFVTGNTKYVIMFEKCPALGGVERTHVTLIGNANLRGVVSAFAGTNIMVKFVSSISSLRKKFCCSFEIDAFRRNQIGAMIKSLPPSSESCIASVLFKDLSSMDKKRSATTGWGISSSEVFAHFIEVAAYFWNYDSRHLIQTSGEAVREVHMTDTPGTQHVYRRRELHGAHSDIHRGREFFSKMTIDRIDADTIIICIVPAKPEDTVGWERHKTSSRSTLVAEESISIRFERKSSTRTRVDFAVQLNLGGHVSKKTLKSTTVQIHEELLTECQTYFLLAIPASELSTIDGQALAAQFHTRRDDRFIEQRVDLVLSKSVAMKELHAEYPWIADMFKASLKGKLRPLRKVKAPAHSVQAQEGAIIGTSLGICLATGRDHLAGVDEWIIQYPALTHLDSEYTFFRPMLNAMSKRLVGEVGWGVKLRVGIIASISLVDIMSDLVMILVFFAEGRTNFAVTLLIFLSITMLLHGIITVLQNYGVGAKQTMLQVLLTLSGFKPVYEAYQVGTAADVMPGQKLSPEVEMTASRVIELFSENIPATFIQISAIIDLIKGSESPSMVSIGSLLITLLSAGMISAQISYDYDVEPLGRLEQPLYYGMLKDDSRARLISFLLMMLMSAGQLFTRCFSFVLLSQVESVPIGAIVFSAELAIFLIYKVLKDDAIVPFTGHGMTVANYFLSMLWRVISKCVTDFTCCIQFRHANEIGGAYFTLTFLFNLCILMLSIFMHSEEFGHNETYTRIAWASLTLMILIAGLFLSSIKQEYVRTFLDTNCGWENDIVRFQAATTDVQKFSTTIYYNSYRWRSIRGDVKEWVQSRWFVWQADRPYWLTQNKLERVPVEWIPAYEQREEYAKRARQNRRNSSIVSFIKQKQRKQLKVAPEG